ncbi:hypothetical protein Pmani_028103 [Petrolisthes manimaculis]|uniref:Uncharacterized protein n=1 Tax=Petrolisthes manimaculis TaxID=1843537 RepID=A0AAE1TYB9_9EUCA|nr:hypothetical protein Pmani_028103 [Petrolisthes manimaculis]
MWGIGGRADKATGDRWRQAEAWWEAEKAGDGRSRKGFKGQMGAREGSVRRAAINTLLLPSAPATSPVLQATYRMDSPILQIYSTN